MASDIEGLSLYISRVFPVLCWFLLESNRSISIFELGLLILSLASTHFQDVSPSV